jgi:hypothetical protein
VFFDRNISAVAISALLTAIRSNSLASNAVSIASSAERTCVPLASLAPFGAIARSYGDFGDFVSRFARMQAR